MVFGGVPTYLATHLKFHFFYNSFKYGYRKKIYCSVLFNDFNALQATTVDISRAFCPLRFELTKLQPDWKMQKRENTFYYYHFSTFSFYLTKCSLPLHFCWHIILFRSRTLAIYLLLLFLPFPPLGPAEHDRVARPPLLLTCRDAGRQMNAAKRDE
jgi:hypothetical protein